MGKNGVLVLVDFLVFFSSLIGIQIYEKIKKRLYKTQKKLKNGNCIKFKKLETRMV